MKQISLLAGIALSGCTSLSNNVNLVTKSSSETAILLVYRQSAFQAGAVSLYVGKSGEYFIELRNNQYAEVNIDAGAYIIQAKASGAPASEIAIKLSSNEKVYLASEHNPEMLGAIAIPIIANMVPTFILKKVECPNKNQLAGYSEAKTS